MSTSSDASDARSALTDAPLRAKTDRFDALYEQHSPTIFRLCLRLCGGCREEAEDLAQEALIAAFRSLPRFAGRAKVTTWLYTVTIRTWQKRRERETPAYAAVEESMRQIRTAEWSEQLHVYETKNGKSQLNTFRYRYKARLLPEPPALRTEYPGTQINGSFFSLIEPSHARVTTDSQGRSLVVIPFRIGTGGGTTSLEGKGSPAQLLHALILNRLMAPADKGKGTAAWRSRVVTRNGRSLWRFDSGMGQGADATRDTAWDQPGKARLTKPGYHSTLWADPATRRIVRSESEYYDGQTHTLSLADNYHYDLPLPDTLFRPTPGSQ